MSRILGIILFIGLSMRLITILTPTIDSIFNNKTPDKVQTEKIPLLRMGKNSSHKYHEERTEPVQHLVIHSFALSVPEMIKRLNEQGASTHYIIDINGKTTKLIDEDKVAYHAGKSFWRGKESLNKTSIGIELQSSTLGQTPFPKKQMDTFIRLATEIMNRHQIDPKNVVAHSDIAPTRKVDVGKTFPWQEVAKHNIGIYPQKTNGAIPNNNIEELLKKIGYDTTDMDKALLAFERRFMPELIATDNDIHHLEENLQNKKPILNETVLKRLNEVADSYK